MAQKLSFFNKIPRVVYYMQWFTPLKSLFYFSHHKNPLSEAIVQLFEKKFAAKNKSTHGIALSHARICLYFILRALKLSKNSKILMTPINIPDMVNVISSQDLSCVYIDLEKNNYGPDLNHAEKLYSKHKTECKVLFVTILNGIIPDLEALQHFATQNNLYFLLDCTQAYGAKYKEKELNSYCDFAFYALCDLKDIHTHMGGMLLTDSDEYNQIIRTLSKNELKPIQYSYYLKFLTEDFIALGILNRKLFSFFIFYIIRFLHLFNADIIAKLTSGAGIKIFNVTLLKGLFGRSDHGFRKTIPPEMLYQFTGRQAQIGLNALESSDEKVKQRTLNAKIFLQHVDIPLENLPSLSSSGNHSFWKFPIITEQHKELQDHLLQFSIDSACSNLPLLGNKEAQLSNAHYLLQHSLYIPLHHYLTEQEVVYIAEKVTEFFDSNMIK